MEIFRKIFKRKSKVEKEVLILDEDKTFENEVEKPKFKEQIDQTVSGTVSQTRSETKLG